ncbi:MAG TPA: serine dehydratase, partial [Terrimesophilobacter sp.]|nr:serine dehydratase [Terrimesophilobacter sp.]
ELTFGVNRRLVRAVDLVTDDQLLQAMAFAFDRLKIVLEPSGATGLASVMFGMRPEPAAKVGVILSGGNVGIQRFRELMARAGASFA